VIVLGLDKIESGAQVGDLSKSVFEKAPSLLQTIDFTAENGNKRHACRVVLGESHGWSRCCRGLEEEGVVGLGGSGWSG
jgi:hypothetical protein